MERRRGWLGMEGCWGGEDGWLLLSSLVLEEGGEEVVVVGVVR